MSGHIEEKLIEIERYAKTLFDQYDPMGHEMQQNYVWLLGCIDSIRLTDERFTKQVIALQAIKTSLGKGGDPSFLIKRINVILNDLKAL